MLSQHYEKGISCPYCWDKTSQIRKESFAQHQLQVELATSTGRKHIGQSR